MAATYSPTKLRALANHAFDHIPTPKPTIAQTGWKPDAHTLRQGTWEEENVTVIMLGCANSYVTCYVPDTGHIEHVKDSNIVPGNTQYKIVKKQ